MIDPEQLKSRLSIRLILAVALIVVAVGVFSLIDRFSKSVSNVETPKPVQSTAQIAPERPAVLQRSAPQPLAVPESAPAPVSSPVSAPEPVTEPVAEPLAVEEPPPPSVSNVAPHLKPSPAPRRAERKARKSGRSAEKTKGAYALQFGVFSSQSNSDRMVSLLEKKGVRANVGILVLAGPYSDKDAAEKEKAALPGALLVELPGKKFALQVGAFESAAHARALAESLGKKNIPALIEYRVRAGRFSTRKKALDAAKRTGTAAIVVKR